MATINDLGMPNPISTPFGGTGLATITSGAILGGNGAAPLARYSTNVDGATLIGATAAAPAFATLTAGTNTTITNGHNSITIGFTGSGSGATVQSFTPTGAFTSGGSSTFSGTGSYVQVGKMISFEFTLTMTFNGGGTQLLISGFPGVPVSLGGSNGHNNTLLIITSSPTITAQVANSGNLQGALFYSSQPDQINTTIQTGKNINAADLNVGTQLQGSGFYFVS